MDRTNQAQKKKVIFNFIYASIIGLFIIGCALTIAFVSQDSNKKVEIGSGEDVVVSNASYVVPMKNYTIKKDYSGKELQYNDTLKQWEIHKAVDFVPTDNTDVFAVSNGTVSKVYTNHLEGTVVEISHGNGVVSVYKSLEKADVKVGDKVSAGQVIGSAGETMSQELKTGVHLHFEMLINGTKVNPNEYLDLSVK